MILPVKPAILIKRYKRFLADIELPNGEITTIHCANTGAMTGCAEPGDTVWYSTSDNPKRKYPFSWELTQTQQKELICVNTQRANQLVEEALILGHITELSHYKSIQREVKYGNENSKVDFLLTSKSKSTLHLEVKSATLKEQTSNKSKQGFFPDAVTIRGQKHLRELTQLSLQGQDTALLFAVLHSGIDTVCAAHHIDEKYSDLLFNAKQAGVKILAYKADFSLDDKAIKIQMIKKIPVTFPQELS